MGGQKTGRGDGGDRGMEVEKPGLGTGSKKEGKLKRFKAGGKKEEEADQVGRSGFRAAVASVMELE